MGTWFYKDTEKSVAMTFEDKVSQIKKILNVWKSRHLTLMGKTVVIKTMCLSKINYAMSSIQTPSYVIEALHEIFIKYIWDNKPPKIKTNVIFNDYDDGGIKFPNVKNFLAARHISWIKLLRNYKESIPWFYLNSFLKMKLDDYLKCTAENIDIPNNIPTFYKEILSTWFKTKNPPIDASDILRQVIWLNRFIKIDNKSLFNEKLYANNMVFISDIFKNGSFVSYEELIRLFGNHISFFNYNSLKNSIPNEWRRKIKSQNAHVDPHNETIYMKVGHNTKPVQLIKGCEIYWTLHNVTTPTCIKTWFEKHFIDFTESKWKHLFKLTKTLTRDTKLVEFQFKILHRTLATDSYVSNFDKSVNKNCSKCNVDNNIAHLFCDCIKVSRFWQNLKAWLNNVPIFKPDFTTTAVIFGVPTLRSFSFNFLMLHCKWFIYKHRNEANISIIVFYSYLKCILEIEMEIYVNREMKQFYNQHLKPMHNALPRL